MTESDYTPIDCAIHDVLEASAVRRAHCRVRWTEGEGVREEVTTIDDIFARDGAEYLVLGSGAEIRLDRLVEVEPQG